MMKSINKIVASLVLLGLVSTSCGDDLEEFNVNDRNITEEQLIADFQHVGSLYKPIFEGVCIYSPAWKYQLQGNKCRRIFRIYDSS